MDHYVDALLLYVHRLEMHLRQNYGFVGDYLPESVVSFLHPYMNNQMCSRELKKQLPSLLFQTILASFLFFSVTVYLVLWCLRKKSRNEEEVLEEVEDSDKTSETSSSDESETDDDEEEEEELAKEASETTA